MTKTLLAVDGNSLAHRAYHAYERTAMTDSGGRPIWAVYGFVALLAGICDKVHPDALVVGFDDPKGSERKARCPQYKATRGEKTPELYAQIADIHTILHDLRIPVISPRGLEADDVMASAAACARTAGWGCVIATSDRDAFCLIDDTTTVLRLVSGLDNAVEMTPAKLFETYGVQPSQYLDYATLRGDTSDNLPGVLGIGEKTAAKILAALGSLDDALADLEAVAKVAGPAAAKKLVTPTATEAIARNRDIMAPVTTVTIDVEGAQLAGTPDHVRDTLLRWELPSLVTRAATYLSAPVPSTDGFPAAVLDEEPPPLDAGPQDLDAAPPADVPSGPPTYGDTLFSSRDVPGSKALVGASIPAGYPSTDDESPF